MEIKVLCITNAVRKFKNTLHKSERQLVHDLQIAMKKWLG